MAKRPLSWAFASLFVVGAAACGGGSSSEEPLSDREVEVTRLVEAQVADEVTCRDNGAVNTELRPEYEVGYSCFNEAGDFYSATVSADGELRLLSGPVRLTPAGS